MTNLQTAAQQALEALELAYAGADVITVHGKAITALRAALAEPEQEPVQTITRADQERGMARHFERTSGQQTARRTT